MQLRSYGLLNSAWQRCRLILLALALCLSMLGIFTLTSWPNGGSVALSCQQSGGTWNPITQTCSI